MKRSVPWEETTLFTTVSHSEEFRYRAVGMLRGKLSVEQNGIRASMKGGPMLLVLVRSLEFTRTIVV